MTPSMFAHGTEFIPAETPGSKSTLIVLHGRGDSSAGYTWLPPALRLPHVNYLLLNAPDEWGPGLSWYERPPNQAPGIIRSRKLLFDLLDELESKFSVPSSSIGLLGFSQGCLMCLDVGLRWPKKLACIVGISGYLFFENEYPEQFSPVARDQKWFVSHGLHDDVLPFNRTAPQIQKLMALGVPIEWHEYSKDHTIDPDQELDAIRKFLSTQLR